MSTTNLARIAGTLLATAAVHAQSLSTGFDGGNSSGPTDWHGAFFDVTALHPDGITITGWDIDTTRFAGWPMAVRVWVKEGSFVGATTDASQWTLMGHMPTRGVGRGNPLPVTIGNLHIRHNETYGVRIGISPGSVIFKNEEMTAANPIFANDDLRIDLTHGTVQNRIWVGGFTPRGLNLTVYYKTANHAHFGACCMPDGACQELNRRICISAGGTFHGRGISCASVTCQIGACCFDDGSCSRISRAACRDQGGIYHGDGTTCSGISCPQPGACCHQGACSRVLESRCRQLGGTFHGQGTHCPSNCVIQWRTLGTGVNGEVFSVAIYNNQPVIDGTFTTTAPVRWDGSSWIALGAAPVAATALTIFNGDLILGGSRVARWNPSSFTWDPMGGELRGTSSYPGGLFPAAARDFAIYNDELILGGSFTDAGTAYTDNIARWDGTRWRFVGLGLTYDPAFGTGAVNALAVFKGDLIAGGRFTETYERELSNIARWDGTQWHPLGNGTDDDVNALAVYQEKLIAAGRFGRAGDLPASQIAEWNGSSWQPLRAGVTGGPVTAMATYQGELIVGGHFTHAEGIPVRSIVRWDGMYWRPLGLGLEATHGTAYVNDMAVWGDELLVGGRFSKAGGEPANNIALWKASAPAPCYANCDGSTTPPYLSANDVVCFIEQFSAGLRLAYVQRRNHYANCDGSTEPPVLTVDDFICFLQRFAEGCP